MAYLIKNATVATGEEILEHHHVLIQDGKIQTITPYAPDTGIQEIDLKGDFLVPGFIDLQVNGGAGAFFTKDINEKSVKKISEAHLEFGTTSYLPTLISTSFDRILEAIEVIRTCKGKNGVLGMHLEGPYFNVRKKGAHFEKFIHKPLDHEIDELIEKGKDVIELLTLAPEVVGDKHIRKLVDSGIKVSAGHSNASYREALEAFQSGITKVTHLFNAMSQFNSRNPGLVGAFFNSNVWGAVIADGVHVDFGAIKVAHTIAKGRLFLVSDASFVKHPVPKFEFDGFNIHMENGHYYTEEGNLAGASISLYDAFKNCVEKLSLPLLDVVKMASTYPAQYLGVDNEIGYVKQGYRADLVILDKALRIRNVMKDGEMRF